MCKFCIQSPLACAPGASGADLKRTRAGDHDRPGCHGTFTRQADVAGGRRPAGLGASRLRRFSQHTTGSPVKRNVIAVQARAEQAVTAVADEIGMAPVARVAM